MALADRTNIIRPLYAQKIGGNVMFDEEIKKCCGTCAYSCYDRTNGYVCVNDQSEYAADFVEYDHVCEDYEEKQ